MRAQIVDRASARYDLVFPFRGVRGRLEGSVSVEVGFEVDDSAEHPRGVQFAKGEEVGVPSSVWICGQELVVGWWGGEGKGEGRTLVDC